MTHNLSYSEKMSGPPLRGNELLRGAAMHTTYRRQGSREAIAVSQIRYCSLSTAGAGLLQAEQV
jgi:hypothetical protein